MNTVFNTAESVRCMRKPISFSKIFVSLLVVAAVGVGFVRQIRTTSQLLIIKDEFNATARTFLSGGYQRQVSSSKKIPSFEESLITEGLVNSLKGTSGSGVPGAFRTALKGTGKEIFEDADTFYGSQEAVDALEADCGWDPQTANFQKKDCLRSHKDVNFSNGRPEFPIGPELMDIVTPSIRNLDFLNEWREFFQGYHVIVIQDGDPDVHLEIPDWVDYELYNRNDIKQALGKNHWIISSKDASIRNFGFLVSKKPYIYTIDDDCRPAMDKDGYLINPLNLHLKNLLAPSNPYFYNTLYDPYNEDSDFVRGYPYSLRNGVPTAISHGLWMHTPDYDAPTQLLKPDERVTKMHDMTETIPIHTFYPMCSMNVAFSRELIGPAFMQGLMGEGQPWGRYDDMFAGWASKAVADHLKLGVKSGRPYIRHIKASNPFTNLKKEYKGLWWQETLIRFFQDELSFSEDANTPHKAYKEVAHQIQHRFNQTHDYFSRLSEAMILWIDAWEDVASGKLKPVPSRKASDDIKKRFTHLNLGEKSHFSFRVPRVKFDPRYELAAYTSIFAYWEPFPCSHDMCKTVVTQEDRNLGQKIKAYLFPLPDKFHRDVYERYNIYGCLEEPCSSERVSTLPFQYLDYSSEAIILRKFMSSLSFVLNPEEADLILVPALGVMMTWYQSKELTWYQSEKRWRQTSGCRNGGICVNDLFEELSARTKDSLRSGKKHLFLGTQDSSQNHQLLRDIEKETNGTARVVTLGPGELVVPSLNPNDIYQPSKWGGGKPLEERDIFVLADFGARYDDRLNTLKQLKTYTGSKKVILSDSGDKILFSGYKRKHANSVFVLCLPGDLPYQKRLFDTLIAVSIPVVVRRNYSTFDSYWQTMEQWPQSVVPSVELSYPRMKGISYSELVVELDPKVIEEGRLMEFLEAYPKEEVLRKLERIEKLRTLFLYDFEGSSRDAFSVLLENVAEWLRVEP